MVLLEVSMPETKKSEEGEIQVHNRAPLTPEEYREWVERARMAQECLRRHLAPFRQVTAEVMTMRLD